MIDEQAEHEGFTRMLLHNGHEILCDAATSTRLIQAGDLGLEFAMTRSVFGAEGRVRMTDVSYHEAVTPAAFLAETEDEPDD